MGIGGLRRRIKDIQLLREKSEDVDIGFFPKWRMWLSGFVSQSYVLLSLGERSCDNYVSDIVRLKKTPRFNGYYSVMLYDKLYFAQMMRGFADNMPVTYGLIDGVRFWGFEGDQSVVELCRRVGRVVIKPLTGCGGEGVKILGVDDGDRWRLNGEEICHGDVAVKIGGVDGCVVTEFVEQGAYARRVYAGSTNTLRIQTMWDADADEPFVGASFHRFGTRESAPADNCGAGGLLARVNIENGELSEAITHPEKGSFLRYSKHPESGERIEGLVVPRWDVMTQRVLDMARSLSFLWWVAWDIVVTDDGFKVIEGNNYPDLNMLQIHEPLLKRGRVRKFFERRLAALDREDRAGARHRLPFRL